MKIWFVELENKEEWLGQLWFLFNPKIKSGEYKVSELTHIPGTNTILNENELDKNDKVSVTVRTKDCYFVVLDDGILVSDVFEDVNDAFRYIEDRELYTRHVYVAPVELKKQKPNDYIDRLIDKYEKYVSKRSIIYLANRLFLGEYNIDAKELTLYDKKRILKRIAETDIIEFYNLTLDCLLCQGKTILYKMLSDIHEQILDSNDKETKKGLFKKFRNITKKYLCLARELDTEINDMTFDIINSIKGDINED